MSVSSFLAELAYYIAQSETKNHASYFAEEIISDQEPCSKNKPCKEKSFLDTKNHVNQPASGLELI
jgi:hypothetical protein